MLRMMFPEPFEMPVELVLSVPVSEHRRRRPKISDHVVVVGFSHGAGEVFVGFVVADELFFGGVPFEFSAEADGDDTEVTEAGGAVADFGGADGGLAGLDAVDEVGHVVVADVDTRGVFGEFLRQERAVAGGDDAARDPDPAVGAVELDAVLLAVAVLDAAVPFTGGGAVAGVDDAIIVGIGDGVFAGGGEASWDHVDELFAFDGDGAGVVLFEGPKDDVVVVGAPVGHRSAGVVPPVAEAEVGAFLDVRGLGGLAHPEVVVEAFGDFGGLEGALAQAGREPDFDFADLADAAVADEVAGQPEVGIAALLGAGLEDAVGLTLDFDQTLAFVNGEGQWFFAVDVFASFHGGHGDEGVPVVDGSADDGVYVVAFEELAEVGVAFSAWEVPLGGCEVAGVDVANCDDFAVARGVLGVAATLSTASDEAQADGFAGQCGRLSDEPSGQGEGKR